MGMVEKGQIHHLPSSSDVFLPFFCRQKCLGVNVAIGAFLNNTLTGFIINRSLCFWDCMVTVLIFANKKQFANKKSPKKYKYITVKNKYLMTPEIFCRSEKYA